MQSTIPNLSDMLLTEKIYYKHVSSIIPKSQHGFVKGRSTTSKKQMQKAIDNLSDWSTKNKLKLNVVKIYHFTYTRKKANVYES